MIQALKRLSLGMILILLAGLFVGCGESPALWTVTFDTGEGGSNVPSQSVESGKSPLMPSIVPTKEGYRFIGWALEDEDGELRLNQLALATSDITYFAIWMPDCDCDEDGLYVEPLEEGLELQIRRDYFNQEIEPINHDNWCELDDISIRFYYGTFSNGAVVLICNSEIIGSSGTPELIGGVVFWLGDGDTMRVWNDSQFYGLREAYDQGFLAVEDLQLIYKRQTHRGCEK